MQPDPLGVELPTLGELIRRPEWFDRAACRGEETETFFPGKGGTLATARAICSKCSVQSECLSYALEVEAVGVWAGTTAKGRAAMRQAVA
jgi:WhiB family redox-sensing transcriptional regulator